MISKICCLGNTASGKSILAKKIAQELNLPQFSLDKIYYKVNWSHISRSEFLSKQKEILNQNYWIIDGTFSECGLRERFEAADIVIFLDSSSVSCLHYALSRRGKNKDRLPDGVDDKHLSISKSLKFLFDILTFNFRDRRRIVHLAQEFPKKFQLINSWNEEDEVVNRLKSQTR